MTELESPFLCPLCRALFWSRFATCRGRRARGGHVWGKHLAHDPVRVVASWRVGLQMRAAGPP